MKTVSSKRIRIKMDTLKIGIIGAGVVGSAVIRILMENKDIITARAQKHIEVAKVIVRDKLKAQNTLKGLNIPISDDIEELFLDDSIQVIVELMGGVELAYDIARRSFESGKSFVTANKAMLAYHRYELSQYGLPMGFEASVCGGIPIILALKNGLSANHILAIYGILNGTSNYILTQMREFKESFETALIKAQELGYAESDPTLDISGGDAGHKLLILASLAYGINALPEQILIEGIEGITPDDMEFAHEFDYVIKLLGIAKKEGDCIELRIHPAMINKESMIGKVDGVMNGISVIGDCVGESMYYGAGAGGRATASSVISDIIAIARGDSAVQLGFSKPLEAPLKLKRAEDIYSRYYIRLYALDKPGVLGLVSQILGRHNISIDAFLQKETNKEHIAKMLFSTHHCFEREIESALSEIHKLDSITQKPYKIRIEA